jgi:hypothetical protein
MVPGHGGALVDVVTVLDQNCFCHDALKHWGPPQRAGGRMVPEIG